MYCLDSIQKLRDSLVRWFLKNGRKFPWRNSRDPYRILIAEIMLHRTRVEQVIPVYQRFMELYPDPWTLYRAGNRELVEIFSSLGLRWRAELFLQMRKVLVEKFGGKVPCRRDELRMLPGVSDYICSMVRALAFQCPDPPLDTNTVRFTGRFFALRVTDSSRRNRQFRTAVSLLMDPDRPAESALALVDLGSLVCRQKDPLCQECPVMDGCLWFREYRM